MKVEITINTEGEDLQLVHAILADIIAKTALEVHHEVDKPAVIEGNNCGFDWKVTIDPEF